MIPWTEKEAMMALREFERASVNLFNTDAHDHENYDHAEQRLNLIHEQIFAQLTQGMRVK